MVFLRWYYPDQVHLTTKSIFVVRQGFRALPNLSLNPHLLSHAHASMVATSLHSSIKHPNCDWVILAFIGEHCQLVK